MIQLYYLLFTAEEYFISIHHIFFIHLPVDGLLYWFCSFTILNTLQQCENAEVSPA